jgi:hypothetical protein
MSGRWSARVRALRRSRPGEEAGRSQARGEAEFWGTTFRPSRETSGSDPSARESDAMNLRLASRQEARNRLRLRDERSAFRARRILGCICAHLRQQHCAGR